MGSEGINTGHKYMLKPFWEKHDRFWVTFDKENARNFRVPDTKESMLGLGKYSKL